MNSMNVCRSIFPRQNEILILANTGRNTTPGFDMDIAFVKLDEYGDRILSYCDSGICRFDFPGYDYSRAVDFVITPDSGIVILGYAHGIDSVEEQPVVILKLNKFGVIDSSFGDQGVVESILLGFQNIPEALTIDDSGNIFAVGAVYDTAVVHSDLPFIMKLDPFGKFDSTFGGTGKMALNYVTGLFDLNKENLQEVINENRHSDGGTFNDVLLDGKGGVYCAGSFFNGGWYATAVVQFTATGKFDTTFYQQGILGIDYAAGYNNWAEKIQFMDSSRLILSANYRQSRITGRILHESIVTVCEQHHESEWESILMEI